MRARGWAGGCQSRHRIGQQHSLDLEAEASQPGLYYRACTPDVHTCCRRSHPAVQAAGSNGVAFGGSSAGAAGCGTASGGQIHQDKWASGWLARVGRGALQAGQGVCRGTHLWPLCGCPCSTRRFGRTIGGAALCIAWRAAADCSLCCDSQVGSAHSAGGSVQALPWHTVAAAAGR